MQSQIQAFEPNSIKRTLTVEVSIEEVNQALNKVFKDIAQKARIDGFRKGHIPRHIIELHYGSTIHSNATESIVNDAIRQAVSEHNLLVLDTPAVDIPVDVTRDCVFKFSFTVEVVPTINMDNLNEVSVDLIKVETSDEDVSQVIESLRKSLCTWEDDAEGVVTEDSKVVIDFAGFIDGEALKEGAASDFELEIANNRMIPGFASSIIGHKLGEETFEITAKFPENYHVSELCDKEAKFNITLKAVKRRVLPELNQEFLSKFNYTEETIEEFREDLKKNLMREAERVQHNYNQSAIINALVEKYNDFELPHSMLKLAYQDEVKKESARLGGKLSDEVAKLISNSCTIRAEKSVRIQLIMQALVKQYNIDKSDDQEIRQELIDSLATAYDNKDEFLDALKKEKSLKEFIDIQVEDRVLFKQIKSLIQVNEKTISTVEATNKYGSVFY